ncbi:MAG: hypothetical protein GEU86_22280 [Actinophytocola sp.]|nr:hypothetical protein [Actinophytocola sp.]
MEDRTGRAGRRDRPADQRLIGGTTTTTELTVTAQLDTGDYPTGVKISDRETKALPITRDAWHGDWNYRVHPTRDTPQPH